MLKKNYWPHHRTTLATTTSFCLSLFCTFALLLLPLPVSAHARTSMVSPTFRVKAGFDARYRDGNWIPVQVSLSNTGADFAGSVAVDMPSPYGGIGNDNIAATYQAPVSLATGAQKQVTLYVPFYFGSQGTNQTITVRLLDTSGHVVSTQISSLRTLGVSDVFIGVLSDQSTGFGPISAISLPNQSASVIVEPLDATTMPTLASVLKNFDLIVLDNFTTSSLSTEQLTALESWVNQGGDLVVVGGPEWHRTLSPLPADLLPVSITGTQTLAPHVPLLPVGGPAKSGSAHSSVADSVQAPVVVSSATPNTGSSTILSAGNVPLIVQAQQQQGLICYLAFDPTLDPITSWPGASTLWKGLLLRTLGDQLLTPGPSSGFGSLLHSSGYNTGSMDVLVQSLLPNTFPSVWLILVLLLGYILVLGPVRFLIVRRLKKRDWSWRIVLCTILVFTLLSYGIAVQQKGTSVLSSTISITQLGKTNSAASDTQAHVTTYVGVFVPSQGDFHVHIANTSLVEPSSNLFGGNNPSASQSTTIIPGSQGTDVALQSVNIWTLHTVVSEQNSQVHGGIVSHLTLSNGTLTGSVTNTLPYALNDVYVLMAYRYLLVGHLAPGQTQQVNLPLRIDQGDPGMSIADQIANSRGVGQQYNGPYNNGQSVQTETQRHVSLLSLLSGENNSYCTNGPCYQPAIYTKTISASGVIINSSGSYLANSHDPLLIPGASATLIGWADNSSSTSSAITINGAASAGMHEDFVQAPLDVSFSGSINLPSSFVGSQLVDVQAQGNNVLGQLPGIYTMTTGSMTFEFTLPNIMHLRVSSATINETANLSQVIQSMSPNQPAMTDVNHVSASLYNWHTGKWDAVLINAFAIQIKSTDPYIGHGGRVLLQIANQDATQGTIVLSRPTLQLQGTV